MSDYRPTYQDCDEISIRCPVSATFYGIELSGPAAIFFGVAFLLCLLVQLYFGFRARTWNFSIWLALGTLLEVIGYIARYKLADNEWSLNSFIIQYIGLLLAPTLIAAAVSITFKALVLWYGKQWSVLRPALYPWVFVGSDFVSIFVQIIGGGAVAAATTGNGGENIRDLGEGMVIAGVVFQVFNMICCGTLMIIYIRRRKAAIASENYPIGAKAQRDFSGGQMGKGKNMATSRSVASGKEAKRAHIFIWALAVAYVAILIRCIYRIFETLPSTARDVNAIEPLFLVLDGGMILLSVGLVTFIHPWNFFPYLGISRKIRKDNEANDSIPLNDTQPEPQSQQQQQQ
ncbi:RTA1 like protein [Sarocladium implicatum]|nr:RTA1 like protein [Sarocladium implicatum]